MMKRMVNRFYLLLSTVALIAYSNHSWSQSDDYAAKASIIDGIRAFEAGEERADSLFVLGERHSDLAALSAYNAGRSLLEKSESGQEARQAFQRAIKSEADEQLTSDAWHNIGNSLLMEQDL